MSVKVKAGAPQQRLSGGIREGPFELLPGTDPALPGIEQPGLAGSNGGTLPQRVGPEIVLGEGTHEAARLFQDQ